MPKHVEEKFEDSFDNSKIKLLQACEQSYFARLQKIYDASRQIQTAAEKQHFLASAVNINALRTEFKKVVEDLNIAKMNADANFIPSFSTWESFEELHSSIQYSVKLLDTNKAVSVNTHDASSSSRLKLPPIELPKFDGDVKHWPIFYECFKNTIHTNINLSDSEKVYYLCGQLSGKALNAIAGISPTGDNYDIIYSTLVDKYQDLRTLGSAYLDEILTLKKIQLPSVDNLNNFIDTFSLSVAAFESLKIPNKLDFIFLHLALKRVDGDTARLFEHTVRNELIPTYSSFAKFIKEQAKIVERTGESSSTSRANVSQPRYKVPVPNTPKYPTRFTQSLVSSNVSKCPLCDKNSHDRLQRCPEFLRLSAWDRFSLIKTKAGCVICLSLQHKSSACETKSVCSTCFAKNHHSLLHFQSNNNVSQSFPVFSEVDLQTDTDVDATKANVSLCALGNRHQSLASRSTALLGTARVLIVDMQGSVHLVRCLLDNASQDHFITSQCCEKLSLNVEPQVVGSVSGFGGNSSVVKGITEVTFQSRFDDSVCYHIRPSVVECITKPLPTASVSETSLSHLLNLPLADDTFNKTGEIDLLIGTRLFTRIMRPRCVYDPKGTLDGLETTLGYVIMGEGLIEQHPITHSSTFCTFFEPIDDVMRKFWELEDVPSNEKKSLNRDDQECEKIYKDTTTRDEHGRYSVALPFKSDPEVIGSSLLSAGKRFVSLERKFKISSLMRNAYDEVVKDYLKNNYLTPVKGEDNSEGYIIPHHGVIRNDRVSTKLRIVLDASACTNKDVSLNQVLYTGPNLQSNIFSILLNFRLFPIAFCADVKQMYLQIKVHPEFHKYLRILYRFDPRDPLQLFEFERVCFGLSSSPYLALRTIKQLCEDEHERFPLATAIIPRDLYMDDIVSSVSSSSEAIELSTQLIDLFKAGGFDLMKWSSNSADLISRLPETHLYSKSVKFDHNDRHKILGVNWDPQNDEFLFEVRPTPGSCTKRIILSTIAHIWDVLGFAAPVILYAKLLIKELWALKIGWDDIPPKNVMDHWKKFQQELPLLMQHKIPRHVGVIKTSTVTLLAFCDASEKAYGAVLYIHVRSLSGISLNFLCAKSKVAPMKVISLARLELCAALLMSNLIRLVLDNYKGRIDINNIYAFSDSTVTLHWIHSSPHRWKVFVANRVTKIQENLPASHFFHITSKENPSDCLSRGLSPAQLTNHNLWLNGPVWAQLDISQWPIKPFKPEYGQEVSEIKTTTLIAVQTEVPLLCHLSKRISNWYKLLRIVVYILRFTQKLSSRDAITTNDLEQAEHAVIQAVQQVHFQKCIVAVKTGNVCPPSVQKLRPILVNGVLRVGGRLANSDLSFEHKHPILLPCKDHVVNLLIDYMHCKNCHTGPQLLLSLLRQRYWILSGRRIVRSRVHACNFCFKARPKANLAPVMADLPKCRFQVSKAFAHTGLDYGGPLNITLSRKRGVRSQKVYLCVFICLTTRAVHIEVAPDLSTGAFLNALKRFIARRGPIEKLYSDNGTNFIGARNYLNELYSFLISKQFRDGFQQELTNSRINWQLIPPNAPHFGGAWEATVKAFKTHLFRVIGAQVLTYEELLTVLCQIEAVLNSRPLALGYSTDPTEPVPLTPAHFLNTVPLHSFPAAEVDVKCDHLLSRYLLLDKLVQSYWRRWSAEYLHTLQVREKWNTEVRPAKKGEIVLIKNDNAPPLYWPLGVIQEVYPGKDGYIRVALVKTKLGTFKRPIIRLCPLPTQ